jgi:signal transduction histidine kinase
MGGILTFPARPARWAPRLAADFSGLAHDLRNVMASLELCAEVLAQPGVLVPEHAYLAGEIRSVADASIGLLRQMGRLAEREIGAGTALPPAAAQRIEPGRSRVATALTRMERLLAAVAGPHVHLQIACAPCWGRLAIPAADLERVLVNLVRNASDAMPEGGRIRIAAQMAGGQSFAAGAAGLPLRTADSVMITVQDDGPGIPAALATRIFEPGFSTRNPEAASPQGVRRRACSAGAGKQPDAASEPRRGLGLAIARDLVESCGGTLKLARSTRGARFEIELPLTNVTDAPASSGRIPVKGGRA